MLKFNDLETGDIVLFSGNYFLSHIIEYFTNSNYSHVGVILKNPNLGDAKFKGIYLLESGFENTPDPENNRIKKGVQIINFEEKFTTERGRINCSLREDTGEWRWLGIQFVIKDL